MAARQKAATSLLPRATPGSLSTQLSLKGKIIPSPTVQKYGQSDSIRTSNHSRKGEPKKFSKPNLKVVP